MVYETGNRTIDDAVERVLAGERLDRRDGLALIAQPVDELAAAADAEDEESAGNDIQDFDPDIEFGDDEPNETGIDEAPESDDGFAADAERSGDADVTPDAESTVETESPVDDETEEIDKQLDEALGFDEGSFDDLEDEGEDEPETETKEVPGVENIDFGSETTETAATEGEPTDADADGDDAADDDTADDADEDGADDMFSFAQTEPEEDE